MEKDIIIDRLNNGYKFATNHKRKEYYKPISVNDKAVGVYRYTCDRCIYEELELNKVLQWFSQNEAFFLSEYK